MSDYLNLSPSCWPACALLQDRPELNLDDHAAVVGALEARYGDEAVYGHDERGVFSVPLTAEAFEPDLTEARAEIVRHHRDFRSIQAVVHAALASPGELFDPPAEIARLRGALEEVRGVVG